MLLALLQYVPFVITWAILGGIALAAYRRTGATGALLIAVAGVVQLAHDAIGMWSVVSLYSGQRGYSNYSMMSFYGGIQTIGHLTASTLLIVGITLLLRRLPDRQRRE